ncbi:hypothetical protein ACOZCG_19965, partial [Streptomyces pseudogriseolus]
AAVITAAVRREADPRVPPSRGAARPPAPVPEPERLVRIADALAGPVPALPVPAVPTGTPTAGTA